MNNTKPIIAVAPMMEWTDRHCRYFLRTLSKHVWLYTEMIHANAVLHGHTDHLLAYHPAEHPLALQLGGSEPSLLAKASKIAEDLAYDEINLNVGCPSPRVSKGRFGACLMAEPDLVADCIAAMTANVSIPVTVKTRIGIDDNDSFDALCHFIETVAKAGCDTFIIHARKAWLHGLSPKENRSVPPLRYDVVYELINHFPNLQFIINGGITTQEEIACQLEKTHGVMIGRAAYHDPYLLATCDSQYFGESTTAPTRQEIVNNMLPYIEAHLASGGRLAEVARHMLNLFHGQQHGKMWRRMLSETMHKPSAGCEVIQQALSATQEISTHNKEP